MLSFGILEVLPQLQVNGFPFFWGWLSEAGASTGTKSAQPQQTTKIYRNKTLENSNAIYSGIFGTTLSDQLGSVALGLAPKPLNSHQYYWIPESWEFPFWKGQSAPASLFTGGWEIWNQVGLFKPLNLKQSQFILIYPPILNISNYLSINVQFSSKSQPSQFSHGPEGKPNSGTACVTTR